jgi:hypothetical protein
MLAEREALNERTGQFVQLVMSSGVQAAKEQLTESSGPEPAFAATPAMFLAYILAQQGNHESAFGVLQLVAQEYPGSYMPYYMMGGAMLATGATAEGNAALERVLELIPGHDGALKLLAH